MKLFRACCLGALALMIAAIAGLLILTFTLGRFANWGGPPQNAAEQMDEFLHRDKESFVIIRDYLTGVRYRHSANSISIWRSSGATGFDGTMSLDSVLGHVPIEDDAVVRAIRQLFRNHYSSIVMSENHIRFPRWRTVDYNWGALYLLEGDEPPGAPPAATITLLAPLSVEGWYFYRVG